MDTAVETVGDEVASRPLRPLVVVTVAAFCISGGKLHTLLRSPGEGPGTRGSSGDATSFELPGCLPHEGTSLEEAAQEAVAAGIPSGATHVEQLHTWNSVDSRGSEPRLEVAYLALSPPLTGAASRSVSTPPIWRSVEELPALPSIHLRILDRARERLRDRLNYTNLACRLLPDEFSLSELQQVYEAVQGKELDKRNFRKWVLANDVVEPTPRYRRDGAHRPARLYRPSSLEMRTLG